ncbi:MAG TPA: maleylpyruvate isomerase family mycothiol-dependent enzyme [Pseudonocardiaceae bacterium]|nr:maleylpyruvate isomerase family mycothiol-dependent enzyme [Pseudonocardiaceae bacterium]
MHNLTTVQWVLSEKQGVTGGPQVVQDALDAHRERLLTLVSEFTDDEWATRSRCDLWSVHEVVRHLVDGANLHGDLMLRQPGRFGKPTVFNPVTSPIQWLAESEGQTSAETVDALRIAVAREHEALGTRIAAGDDLLLGNVVGTRQVHWSLRSLHFLFDAWTHERDIRIPLGLDLPSTDNELRLIAQYVLMLASAVPVSNGAELHFSIVLDGAPDPHYQVDADAEAIVITSGPTPSGDLRGDVGAALDGLTGRGPELAELFGTTGHLVTSLGHLRTLMV